MFAFLFTAPNISSLSSSSSSALGWQTFSVFFGFLLTFRWRKRKPKILGWRSDVNGKSIISSSLDDRNERRDFNESVQKFKSEGNTIALMMMGMRRRRKRRRSCFRLTKSLLRIRNRHSGKPEKVRQSSREKIMLHRPQGCLNEAATLLLLVAAGLTRGRATFRLVARPLHQINVHLLCIDFSFASIELCFYSSWEDEEKELLCFEKLLLDICLQMYERGKRQQHKGEVIGKSNIPAAYFPSLVGNESNNIKACEQGVEWSVFIIMLLWASLARTLRKPIRNVFFDWWNSKLLDNLSLESIHHRRWRGRRINWASREPFRLHFMNKVHHYHHRRKHHKSPNCTIDTAWLYLIAYINISFHIRNDPVCRSTIAQRRPKKAIRKLSGLRHRISWLKFSMGFFCHPKIFRLSGSDLICMTWSDLSSTFAETGFHFFHFAADDAPLSSDEANWIGLCLEIWLNNWTEAKTNKWWHNDSKLRLWFAKTWLRADE